MELTLLPSRTISILMIFLLSCTMQGCNAQAPQSSCLQLLQPCMNYVNGTRDPPSSCCGPLKYVIKSVPECLCSMLSIKGANQAEKAGINLADAQQLPARCGQSIDPLGCILGAPSSAPRFSLRISTMVLAAASWIFVLYFELV